MSKKNKQVSKRAEAKEAKQAKLQEVITEAATLQLMGEVVTWSARSEEPHKHGDLVNALTEAGLDPKNARELLPRHAFSRACKSLADDSVIDVVTDGDTEVTFQFTKRTMRNDEWQYTKDTLLTLNKNTGQISCPKTELQSRAQKLLDAAIDERTPSDITKIVQKLFDKHAALFPIRDQGGCYFVPKEHFDFVGQVQQFLVELGGTMTRFPIPAGTQMGNKAVQDTVAEAMRSIVKDHEFAISQFTVNTRRDTIENAAQRIRDTRVKIEAYANYLQERKEELLNAIEEANAKLEAQVDALAVQKANLPPSEGGLYGYAVTAVIRWMGKNNWDFGECKHTLKAKGLQIADATIRAQLFAGRHGKRGEPASLKEKDIKELEKLRKASNQQTTAA